MLAHQAQKARVIHKLLLSLFTVVNTKRLECVNFFGLCLFYSVWCVHVNTVLYDPKLFSLLGSRFWKTSKRIRAVRKAELKLGKKSFALIPVPIVILTSPFPQRKRKKERMDMLEADQNQAAETERKRLQSSKKRLAELRKCFECVICKSPATFPAVVSPCCNITLGCELCIVQWFVYQPTVPTLSPVNYRTKFAPKFLLLGI